MQDLTAAWDAWFERWDGIFINALEKSNMTNPTPSICRIVRYRLDADDAQRINHERADSMLSKIGNPVQAGDEYPMIITKVWGDTPTSAVNGTVFLDGNHTYWATSVLCGEGERTFSWPNQDRPRVQPMVSEQHGTVVDGATAKPLSEAPKQEPAPPNPVNENPPPPPPQGDAPQSGTSAEPAPAPKPE